MTTEDYTFAKFSQNTFYHELNSRLVDMVGVKSGQRILDLACGTGQVTQIMLERLRGARNTVIIGIDHSSAALRQARASLRDKRDAAVLFVQSQVEYLSEAVKDKVDTVVYCNAIHYIPDKDALMEKIASVVRPGGTFAFNTSFYDGPQEPETALFHRKWMMKAIRTLKQDYGLSLSKAEKVESRRPLTAEQYVELLERHGFRVVKKEVDKVNVPLEGWIDISRFKDFIEGAMPGVPLDKASAALMKAARETYEELKITYVKRNWLDVVAVRV